MVSSYWKAWSPLRLSLQIGFHWVLLGPLNRKLGFVRKNWDSSSKNMNFCIWKQPDPQRLSLEIGFYWVLLGPLNQKMGLLPNSWDRSIKNDVFQLLESMEPFKTFSEN